MRIVGRSAAPAIVAALLAAGCGGGPGGGGGKISDDAVVLAVLNDQSAIYADLSGKNTIEAVRMAVAARFASSTATAPSVAVAET